MRILTIFAALAVSLAVMPLSQEASAHVTVNPNEAVAESRVRTALRVPHGCEGSSTVAIRVKMPEGVTSVKPEMKAGWDITITMRTLDEPVDAGHGNMVSETVDEITWRGGPLPDAFFEEFGLIMRLPAGAGNTLYFPTVQECEEGIHRWIEIPAEGQRWHDLDEPAPFIRLIERKHSH